MRIEEPRRTAEVILGEDKGWSAGQGRRTLGSAAATITLDKPIPVYLVYFTARVEDDGHLATFADIYGHDDRVMSALRGHPVRYTAPEAIDPSEAADRRNARTARPRIRASADAGLQSAMQARMICRTSRLRRRRGKNGKQSE